MSAPKVPGPLAGVRVLDFTQFLSGPYGTMILADLGADIIKVEGPEGDLARHIPPHFVGDDSVYYLSVNRSKRSVAIDMKRAEGVGLARALCLASDVVVENFRPGVLERLGLSATELRQRRPELIWCSISGFGQSGPYRDRPAYDMIVQAMSGGMSLTGEPGRTAVRAGVPIADLSAGMYSVIAILGALYGRRQTGRGDHLDVSMLDCQASMLSYQAAYYLHSGDVPGRQGSGHDSIPTYRTFTAKDGIDVVVTANTERMWQGLCRALGRAELASEPQFATNRERYANRIHLWSVLEGAFRERTAAEWVAALDAQSVPAGVINDIDRVLADPQIQHRNMVEDVAASDGRRARFMGSPLQFSDSGVPPARYPPRHGENTRTVLSEVLGLSANAIAALAAAGVIIDTQGT